MDDLILLAPTGDYIPQIEAYRAAFPEDRARVTYGRERIPGLDRLEEFESAQAWLAWAETQKGKTSFYMTVRKSDGKIVGFCCLRHALEYDDDDPAFCSHIGYSIRPDEQGRGYGKAQLRLVLAEARKLGLEKVRVVCVAENERSRRTILANGGVFVDSIRGEESGLTVCRYDMEP